MSGTNFRNLSDFPAIYLSEQEEVGGGGVTHLYGSNRGKKTYIE